MTATIERARAEDIADVLRLLREHHLPVDGVREHVGSLLVVRLEGALVGSAAVEIHPDGALLRSVAVSSTVRGEGLGRQLTEAAIHLAETQRAPAIFLLTTTADDYFPSFGFERITRAEVPSGVQTSVEFRSACPSSAIVMRKRLSPSHSDDVAR